MDKKIKDLSNNIPVEVFQKLEPKDQKKILKAERDFDKNFKKKKKGILLTIKDLFR